MSDMKPLIELGKVIVNKLPFIIYDNDVWDIESANYVFHTNLCTRCAAIVV